MLIVVSIWLLIGAAFGLPRARARYRATLSQYPGLMKTESGSIKREAIIDAIIEFIKWMLLGLISGISYIAWILLELSMANRKHLEKPNVLGALGFSVLVFVLGMLTLDKRRIN